MQDTYVQFQIAFIIMSFFWHLNARRLFRSTHIPVYSEHCSQNEKICDNITHKALGTGYLTIKHI